MVAKKRTKLADARKPTHSLDAARPSKGAKGGRDASTVRFEFFIDGVCHLVRCLS